MFGKLRIADQDDDAANAATDALFAARFGVKPITSTHIESLGSGPTYPSHRVSQSDLSDGDIANRLSSSPFGHPLPPKDYDELSSATEVKKDTTADSHPTSNRLDHSSARKLLVPALATTMTVATTSSHLRTRYKSSTDRSDHVKQPVSYTHLTLPTILLV